MINIQVYGNANGVTRTITADFWGDVMVGSYTPLDPAAEYFIKLSTSARDTDGGSYAPRLIFSLNDLALNGNKQSATDTSNAYSDVKTMLIDYVYDYINGHTADQYSSGCTEKKPMQF